MPLNHLLSMLDIRQIVGSMIELARQAKLTPSEIQSLTKKNIHPTLTQAICAKKYHGHPDGILSLSVAAFTNQDDSPLTVAAGIDKAEKAGQPITSQTLFNLGSVSKFIIMNMIMRLTMTHDIKLSDPIAKFLGDTDIPNHHLITIEQLLTHHSGLRDDIVKFIRQDTVKFTASDPITKLLDPNYIGKPGEQFYYCNVNFVILAKIIESVTGNDLETSFKHLIQVSLGLKHTRIITETKPDYSYSIGYKYTHTLLPTSDVYIWGAGGFRSTPEDLVILIKNFFENPSYMPVEIRNLVTASCKEVMFEVVTEQETFRWPCIFGLGIEQHPISALGATTSGVIYGHGGWQDSNAVFLAYDPDTGNAYCAACSKTQGLDKLNQLTQAKTAADKPTLTSNQFRIPTSKL